MDKPAGGLPGNAVSKVRLEFLYDGIFAIAMTLLVLDVKVPELVDRRSVGELGRVLAQHGSTLFSYFLSFGMLGLLWYRHNRQFHRIRHVTPVMVFLHVLQLSMAAFFPFCASTFGHYPANYLSMALYTGCILVYVGCSAAVWIVAKRTGALEPELSETDYRLQRRRNLRGLLVVSMLFLFYIVMAIGSSSP